MLPVVLGAAASIAGGLASTVAAARKAGIPAGEAVQNVAATLHSAVSSSDEPGIQLWERRHGPRPARMVGNDRTPFPQASSSFLTGYYRLPRTAPLPVPHYPVGNRFQLAGFVEILSTLVEGGELAGEVLALLASLEGGRGSYAGAPRGYNGGNLRGHNPGNFKWSRGRDATRPAFFLMDSIPSPGMYPAFDNWRDGCDYWIRVLFGQSNFRGALPFATRGDIVGFTAAIGAGGYATSYRQNHRVMIPRYIDRVKAGALAGAIIRAGLLDGYRFNGEILEKLSSGRWIRA